jgi:biotin-(acetyl-CoA carboxylase) ligase
VFPEKNLNELTFDKLTRLNERFKSMIRKFNDELSVMIQKNMQSMREKINEKAANVEETVKILDEQCKTNEITIELMER